MVLSLILLCLSLQKILSEVSIDFVIWVTLFFKGTDLYELPYTLIYELSFFIAKLDS